LDSLHSYTWKWLISKNLKNSYSENTPKMMCLDASPSLNVSMKKEMHFRLLILFLPLLIKWKIKIIDEAPLNIEVQNKNNGNFFLSSNISFLEGKSQNSRFFIFFKQSNTYTWFNALHFRINIRLNIRNWIGEIFWH